MKKNLKDAGTVMAIIIIAGIYFLMFYELSYLIWPEGTLGS